MNLSRVVINYGINISFYFDNKLKNSELVNDLICLKDLRVLNGKGEIVLKIFNPSTRQTLILPRVKTDSCSVWNLFGYDPIDKQFKVLVMTKIGRHADAMCDEFQVLTLGSGNMSWKTIDCSIPHNSRWKRICINGFLYYTSIDWFTKTCEIVCFDIRFEKFTFIEVTRTLKGVLDGTIELINYNGRLGLLQWDINDGFIDGIRFKLWVYEDIGKQEWSNHTFLFSDVAENIDEIEELSCAGATKRKEVVLFSKYQNYPFHVYYFNMDKKTIQRVDIQGTNVPNLVEIFLDHVEDVKLYGNV